MFEISHLLTNAIGVTVNLIMGLELRTYTCMYASIAICIKWIEAFDEKMS